MIIYEEFETLRGRKINRIKSGVFYLSGLVFLIIGVVLLANREYIGASLIITVSPCLMLYPLVRFVFGGKDSLGAVVATVVVEEVLKNEVSKIGKKKKRKR